MKLTAISFLIVTAIAVNLPNAILAQTPFSETVVAAHRYLAGVPGCDREYLVERPGLPIRSNAPDECATGYAWARPIPHIFADVSADARVALFRNVQHYEHRPSGSHRRRNGPWVLAYGRCTGSCRWIGTVHSYTESGIEEPPGTLHRAGLVPCGIGDLLGAGVEVLHWVSPLGGSGAHPSSLVRSRRERTSIASLRRVARHNRESCSSSGKL